MTSNPLSGGRKEDPLSTPAGRDDILTTAHESGVTIVRLTTAALESSRWPEARIRLLSLLEESPKALIVDCRDLPVGAAETMAPALYELLLNCRRRTPAIELVAVGKPAQSIGASSAFLMPPRLDSLEQAIDSLMTRRGGGVPIKLSPDFVSDEPIEWRERRFSFWQSQIGQIAITMLVVGFTGAVVAYSAVASFSAPPVPRRAHHEQRDARVVVQGNVAHAKGRAIFRDLGALVLAWPAAQPATKFKLTAAQLFESQAPPSMPRLVITTTAADGRYAIHSAELPRPVAPYHLLALSKTERRSEKPDESTLRRLSEFFENPEMLLGDHQYATQNIFLDVNLVKDQDFILIDPGEHADSRSASPTDDKPIPPAADKHELPTAEKPQPPAADNQP